MAEPIVKKHTYSAVLINYNHAEFLPSAIKGVLDQIVPFDEFIIIDDASEDASVEVITSHIRGVPYARLLRHSDNRGVVATLNESLDEVKSEWVFFLTADDAYSEEIVLWCERVLERYPNAAMISGNARITNVKTGYQHIFTLPFPQEIGLYDAQDLAKVASRRAVTFFGGSNVFRKDALKDLGGQREELKWHADWFLYLQMAYLHPFAVIPLEMACIRQTESQYSHACRDWRRQRPVIRTFIRMLQKEYPKEHAFFRAAGLLPTYDVEAFFFLLFDKKLRAYLTPLLAWRLSSYKALRFFGRCIPTGLRAAIRRLVRV